MKYSDVKDFLENALTLEGYDPLPLFNPGPATTTALGQLSAGAIVFLQVGSGAGLTTENLFDRPFITVRVVGVQNDFDYAENLASFIDKTFLAVDGNAVVGEAKSLYITRTGGAPENIDFDNASRYHFQASYITETQTGL